MVYLEQADVIRMTSRAREEGLTLVEWARETLRGELKISRGEDLPRAKAVRVARRGTSGSVDDAATAQSDAQALAGDVEGGSAGSEKDNQQKKIRGSISCPHGYEVGWRCTLCGGKVTREMCA